MVAGAGQDGDEPQAEQAAPDADGGDGLPAHWKMLVVDDDESVHQITRMVLRDFHYDRRPLELLHAYSGSEARDMLAAHPDLAVILLDVVMESEHAGLEFADHVRKRAGNSLVRIVLRTGQAGRLQVRDVVEQYDINDFREKVELTEERMFVMLVAALRNYQLLFEVDRMRARQARLAENLAATNHKLETFVHIASHDLQAPLRRIKWRAQRNIQKIQDAATDQETLVDELSTIERYCDQQNRLLRDLVSYSRLGARAPALRTTSLSDVLATAASNLEATIREHAGRVELPAECTLQVQADAGLLSNVFQNLIGNALKFRQRHREPVVVISVDPSATMPDSDRPAVRIDVRDNGRGISEEAIGEVFEPFRRAGDNYQIEGSGLGLSIVREIVQLHQGEITVSSKPDAGSTFSVYLPPAAG